MVVVLVALVVLVAVLVVGIAMPHSWLASLVGCSRLEAIPSPSSLPVTALMTVLLLEVGLA